MANPVLGTKTAVLGSAILGEPAPLNLDDPILTGTLSISFLTGGIFNLHLSNVLIFHQNLRTNAPVPLTSNLSLTQILGISEYPRINPLVVGTNYAVVGRTVLGRAIVGTTTPGISNRLRLVNTLDTDTVLKLPEANNLVLSQSLKTKTILKLSFTQTLNLSQTVDLGPILVDIPQTINLVQTLSINAHSKLRSLTSLLNLDQNLSISVSRHLSFSNSLSFIHGYYKDGIQNYQIFIPEVQINVVPRKCRVVLSVPQRVILLPCPELGDSEVNSGIEAKIKYAIDGTLRTYIRKTNTKKLRYSFILDRDKALELINFIKNFGSQLIKLDNWKGEIWNVFIVNSPEVIRKSRWEPRHERADVVLEFEGIQLI